MSVIKQVLGGKSIASPKALAAMLGTVAMVLTGCGSGTEADQNRKITKQVLGTLKGGGKSAPSQVTQEQVQQAVATSTQPLILVNLEKAKSSTLLVEIGRNGPVQAFATSARQTISLQNGMARGTRGLGGDLMSVDLGGLPQLIASKSGGTVQREIRVLDGEDATLRLGFSCSVTSTRSSHKPVLYQMTESCQQSGGSIQFTNSYTVNGAGTVLKSRQWFGPHLDYIAVQHLKF
ncbi:YjbF family lipoprotein [Primorskyibacter aestuariivivens]|uniref:YjbF family lipoprotein n=1 Tax=Primorskyibacter aestuariivivens TaxID=1888912 RepID=UPI0023006D4C|nr:YjbF family lipoprotein [Primorskyibacter aestuariivivens]MDA7427667.1 YjbF family lipoprotein [Primorskyibacter aestuariivivens]